MGRRDPSGFVVVDKEPGLDLPRFVARCRRALRPASSGAMPDPSDSRRHGIPSRRTRPGHKTLRFLTALGKQYEDRGRSGHGHLDPDASGEVTGTWDMDSRHTHDVRRATRHPHRGHRARSRPMVSPSRSPAVRSTRWRAPGSRLGPPPVPWTVDRFDVLAAGRSPGSYRVVRRVLVGNLRPDPGCRSRRCSRRRSPSAAPYAGTRAGSFGGQEAHRLDEIRPHILTPVQR